MTEQLPSKEEIVNACEGGDISIEVAASSFGITPTCLRRLIEQYDVKWTSRTNKKDIQPGQLFGRWEVVRPSETGERWRKSLCRCRCGTERLVYNVNLVRGESLSCGCLRADVTKELRAKRHGEITGTYWSTVISCAKLRGLELKVDREFAWKLFLKQGRRCAISGVELVFAANCKEIRELKQTASLDRIDSSKGYDPDNVQWVHKHLNIMKWDLMDADFVDWCEIVLRHKKPEIFAIV